MHKGLGRFRRSRSIRSSDIFIVAVNIYRFVIGSPVNCCRRSELMENVSMSSATRSWGLRIQVKGWSKGLKSGGLVSRGPVWDGQSLEGLSKESLGLKAPSMEGLSLERLSLECLRLEG